MRRLVLMRHAQTESHNTMGDKARRLVARGVQDAQHVGLELAPLGLDYALVSSATRTRETFAALGLRLAVEFLDDLYYHGSDSVLRQIGEVEPSVQGLLVIGHAPTIPSLVADLAYASNPAEADQAHHWFPTASYTAFTFDGQWADLAERDFTGVTLTGVTRR